MKQPHYENNYKDQNCSGKVERLHMSLKLHLKGTKICDRIVRKIMDIN